MKPAIPRVLFPLAWPTIVVLAISACASGPGAPRRQHYIEQGDIARLEPVRTGPIQPPLSEASLLSAPFDVLFAVGDAQLAPGAESRLQQLSAALEKHPYRQITIEGHADEVGSDRSNQELSQRRAEAVRRYLSEQGVDPDRIDMAARGESKPVASNTDEAGRQLNRRVEIVVRN